MEYFKPLNTIFLWYVRHTTFLKDLSCLSAKLVEKNKHVPEKSLILENPISRFTRSSRYFNTDALLSSLPWCHWLQYSKWLIRKEAMPKLDEVMTLVLSFFLLRKDWLGNSHSGICSFVNQMGKLRFLFNLIYHIYW